MRLITVAIAILVLAACGNRVDLPKFTHLAPNYDERRLEPNAGTTDAFWTNDLPSELALAFRRGFVPVAETSYRGEVGPPKDDVMKLVRYYGASFALVSSSNARSGTRTGLAPVYNMGQTATIRTGSLGAPVTTVQTSPTITYQPTTNSYEVADFHVVFFRKAKPAILGAVFRELTSDERQQSGRNGGVAVREVRDDSVAFRAGLLPNDYIFAVDGAAVANIDSLSKFVIAHAGQEISFTCVRKGLETTVRCTLERPDFVTGAPVPFAPSAQFDGNTKRGR